MRTTLRALQERKAATVKQMQAMLDAAGARDLNAEEEPLYASLQATLDSTKKAIGREEALLEEERTMDAMQVTRVEVGEDRAVAQPFASIGEQLAAVYAAGQPGGRIDPRLLLGAASGASAAVGADGGYLIRKEFSTDLFRQSFETGVLSSRCDNITIGSDADGLEVVYSDETSRATGSRWGGVQVYWIAEADTVTAKKPQLGKWELRLEELMGLAYMTNRLATDATAMTSIFSRAFAEEFAFTIDDAILRGNGVGKPLGLLNHVYSSTTPGSVVSVAKESGQTNDTVVAENIISMWSKVHPSSKSKGAWFVNSEVIPQLTTMQIGTGASGQLVYMAPGGLSGSQYGTIYGRPVIEIEHASALGDLGDIMFADLSQYALITKGGLQQDESIHVRFLYNEKAFRWVARVNGAPKLKTALTPYKAASGAKIAPFVTLAAR
jgi:HK97 family phage major capsid protein